MPRARPRPGRAACRRDARAVARRARWCGPTAFAQASSASRAADVPATGRYAESDRRGSSCVASLLVDRWRRRTGIEPARPSYSTSPVLKTGRTTRDRTPPPSQPIAPHGPRLGGVPNPPDAATPTAAAAPARSRPANSRTSSRGLTGRSGRRRSCWSAWTTATTRPSCRIEAAVAVLVDRGLLHPGRRRRLRLGPDRRRQRAVRRLRDGRHARWSRSTCSAGRATCCRRSSLREVLRGGLAVADAGRLPRRRRPQHRRPRAEVRHGGDRARRPGPAAAQRRRGARAAAEPDQAARASACSTTGTRRPARCSTAAIASMTTLNRDAPADRRWPPVIAVGHRRHRLRPARPPVQDGPGLRGRRGGRRRGGAATSRARGRRRGRVRPRRQPAQPRLGAPAHRLADGRARTSCCCWPTRRPPAACWWPARCPGRR